VGFSFKNKGDFGNLEKFLKKVSSGDIFRVLDGLGERGVSALRSATPKESGATAAAWDYHVDISGDTTSITWTNSHTPNGFPIAIMLQYGHGTGRGGYVEGQDYINPAMRPIFDNIADEVWKVVTSS